MPISLALWVFQAGSVKSGGTWQVERVSAGFGADLALRCSARR